jgi:hypothetical protein
LAGGPFAARWPPTNLAGSSGVRGGGVERLAIVPLRRTGVRSSTAPAALTIRHRCSGDGGRWNHPGDEFHDRLRHDPAIVPDGFVQAVIKVTTGGGCD